MDNNFNNNFDRNSQNGNNGDWSNQSAGQSSYDPNQNNGQVVYDQNQYNQQPYGQSAYGSNQTTYNAAPKKNTTLAILSLVAGILAWVLFCCYMSTPLGIAAIVLGVISKKKTDDGKGMATAGIVLGALGLLGGIIYLMIIFLAALGA